MAKKDKPIKDRWLGARVDTATEAEVNTYLESADDMLMGDLVRKGVKEYMQNHPIKKTVVPDHLQIKPGE